jgi:hypothetical protein
MSYQYGASPHPSINYQQSQNPHYPPNPPMNFHHPQPLPHPLSHPQPVTFQQNPCIASNSNCVNLDLETAQRLDRFKELCHKYEIREDFASKLRLLEGFEIVVVVDDSGSMDSPVTSPGSNAYGVQETRWTEMKKTVSIIVDIASVLDKNGVDIYFLNRPALLNVTHSESLSPAFAIPPKGYTPIVPVLQHIYSINVDTKRLIIIATDGRPTDNNGADDIRAFRHMISKARKPTDHVTILACTDDKQVMSYLNNWDKKFQRLDIVDDYYSERIEVRKAKGKNFKFSFGDYIVKALLGSIDPYFDNLDEKKFCNIL